MSYAIGNVIYGVVGNDKLSHVLAKEWGKDYDTTMEDMGFEHLYEANAPWWFGVSLDAIDETEDVDLLALIEKNLSVSPYRCGMERYSPHLGVLTEYRKKLAAMPEAIRLALPAPKIMIVWESS